MYNCNCMKIVKTTDIVEAGTILELVIPDMELRHGQRIRICFAQTPPVLPEPYKVEVAVNGTKIPVAQDRMNDAYGALSFLYSDQLQRCCDKIKARQFIDVIYGADTVSFMYVSPCRCLPRANVVFPRLPAPVPPAARSIEKPMVKPEIEK